MWPILPAVFVGLFYVTKIRGMIHLPDPSEFSVSKLTSHYPTSLIHYFHLVSRQFDFSQLHTPCILDQKLHMYQKLRPKELKFRTLRFTSSSIFTFILIGTASTAEVYPFAKAKCSTDFPIGCHTGFSSQMAFVYTSKEFFAPESFVGLASPELSRLLNVPILLTWYLNDGSLSEAVVFCGDCAVENSVIYNCTDISERNETCGPQMMEWYVKAGEQPAPCVSPGLLYEFHVESPYHNGSYAAAKALNCIPSREGRPSEVVISTVLREFIGGYTTGADFMLGARPPALSIFAAHSVQVENSRNPYTSPFSSFAWLMILLTVALVGLFLAIAKNRQKLRYLQGVNTMLWMMLKLLAMFLNQSISPGIWTTNKASKVVGAHVAPAVVFIVIIYTSALHSEFTLSKSKHLKINYIHELAASTVYLLFNDSHCPVLQQYRSAEFRGLTDSGVKICHKIAQLIDQCTFIKQSHIALTAVALGRFPANNTPFWEIFQSVVSIGRNLGLICASEIEQVLNAARFSGMVDKMAFLTSQQDSLQVWNALKRSTEVDFGYKLDGEDSYYRPRTGVRLPSNLMPNQQWVRRNLRALFSSGIHDLWSRWERMSAFLRIKRMGEKWARIQSSPRPISLRNSWFLAVVVQVLLPALTLSCLVAVAEKVID